MCYFSHKDILIKSYFYRKGIQVWKHVSDSNSADYIIPCSKTSLDSITYKVNSEFFIVTFQGLHSLAPNFLPSLYFTTNSLDASQSVILTWSILAGFDYNGMYEAGTWIWTSLPKKVWWEDSEPPSACHHLPASSRGPLAPDQYLMLTLAKAPGMVGSVFWVERQPDCDCLWQGLHSAIEDFWFKNNNPPSQTQTNIYKHRQQKNLPDTRINTGLYRS